MICLDCRELLCHDIPLQLLGKKKPQMISVVGNSTCSGFKTGLYLSYHGKNAVRYIKQRGYFMKDHGQISDYFDTKYDITLNRTNFTQI